MADIPFPPGLAPRRVTWTLERAVATFESPLSFASQRVARAGARWRTSIEMPPLEAPDSRLLSGWLDQVSRADNCGLVPVFQNTLASEAHIQLGANKLRTWADGELTAGGWVAAANLFPSVQSGFLRLQAFGGTGPLARSVTVAASQAHVVVVDLPAFSSGWVVVVRTGASFATLLYDSSAVGPLSPGRLVIPVVPTTNALQVSLFNTVSTSAEVTYGDVAVYQCALSNSAAAASATAFQMQGYGNYSGAPTAGFSLFKLGQFFSVRTTRGIELKRAGKDIMLQGSAGGPATVATAFEPPLRGALAMNEPILHLPFCRMRLTEPNSSATIDAPLFGGFAFDLVEWFGA